MVTSLFWLVFWATLAGLLLAAGIILRMRLREQLGKGKKLEVDDDAVRTILETGALDDGMPEPLDLDEIDEQERRFWSETWDEPEEW